MGKFFNKDMFPNLMLNISGSLIVFIITSLIFPKYFIMILMILVVLILVIGLLLNTKQKLGETNKLSKLRELLRESICVLDIRGLQKEDARKMISNIMQNAQKSIDIITMSGNYSCNTYLTDIKNAIEKNITVKICMMHPDVSFKSVKMFCEVEKEADTWLEKGTERTKAVRKHLTETINTYKTMIADHNYLHIRFVHDFMPVKGVLVDKKKLLISSHFLKPELPGYEQEYLYIERPDIDDTGTMPNISSAEKFLFALFNNWFELEFFNGDKNINKVFGRPVNKL